MTYDAIIVGGGPAGLSAALALGRARKRVLLCDAGPRRNAAAEHIHNFLTRDGTSPDEFRAIARQQLAAYPSVEVRDALVDGVTGAKGAFRATLGPDTIEARRALSIPSSSSGWARKRASEIARLTTASPRNSRRSLWPDAASGCSCSQLVWTRACSMRSDSPTGRPSRSASAAAGRTTPGRVRGARRTARRCSRPRPGPSGSSRRPRPRSPSRTPPRGS